MTTAKKAASMPKWKPAPPSLVQLFEQAIASVPGAQTRKVFGYPAAFVNGQMFTGLFQDRMILRLPEADRTKLIERDGAVVFEPMPGRPMREYVVVPGTILRSPKKLSEWLDRAFAYAGSLPPKTAKPKRGKARG